MAEPMAYAESSGADVSILPFIESVSHFITKVVDYGLGSVVRLIVFIIAFFVIQWVFRKVFHRTYSYFDFLPSYMRFVASALLSFIFIAVVFGSSIPSATMIALAVSLITPCSGILVIAMVCDAFAKKEFSFKSNEPREEILPEDDIPNTSEEKVEPEK